jgi:osmotically-inducible protein OsmY
MNTLTNTHISQLTDKQIKSAVEAELDWTPGVDAPSIGVSVDDGVVTLSGEVKTFAENLAARRAALRIHGVNTVADAMTLRLTASRQHSDTEIAKSVEHVLEWDADVPADSVKAAVRDKVVTLTGTVEWHYQREAARRAVERIESVRRVDDQVNLTRRPSAVDAEQRIKNAFARNAILDANAITVTINGTTATLTGRVRSWAEKKQAGLSTWASPHITSVHNELTVSSI